MQEVAKKFYSLEEYLALEATSEEKHEYYNGEIFAMAGGTFRHAQLAENIFASLRQHLRGKPCQPKGSDMRLATPSGLYTYPDASVYCGKPELTDKQTELKNPVVIVEVLSPSTKNYDRGDSSNSIARFLLSENTCWWIRRAFRLSIFPNLTEASGFCANTRHFPTRFNCVRLK
jgi:Uncharacterized protein conserved in cyanobacteria